MHSPTYLGTTTETTAAAMSHLDTDFSKVPTLLEIRVCVSHIFESKGLGG